MPEFQVTWKIQLQADTPLLAALEALDSIGDTARVFDVTQIDDDGKAIGETEEIDLFKMDDEDPEAEPRPDLLNVHHLSFYGQQ